MRRDRFEGFVLGDEMKFLQNGYFADSFGLKSKIVYSVGSESVRMFDIGVGYNPKIESIFLSVGMNGFRIH